MQIFKFGGASVKDAQGVENILKVLTEVGYKNTLIVISAMGKMTNTLECVVDSYFNDKNTLKTHLNEVKKFHQKILENLFPNKNHIVYSRITLLFEELEDYLKRNKSPNYNFVYDQIVPFGELISTTIVSYYLLEKGIENNWLDVRNFIKTSENYRDATVNWEATQKNISKGIDIDIVTITQGFIGADSNNNTTTLGREGSDYTAAIFAYCLNATSVIIWKDVPGVLNADPRYFKTTTLLHQISYEEAIELAFYGASVIHPKTLQPLQRKEIPLFVKSFLNPKNKGTLVSKGVQITPLVPCFIVKKNQTLLSLSSLDFSFIVEENISEIFALLHQYQLKVDVIQNSAISFSVCVDDTYNNLENLLQILRAKFKVTSNIGVSLYTIRHFNKEALASLTNEKEVLLLQENKKTVQLVTRD